MNKLLILFVPIAVACAQQGSTEFLVNEAAVESVIIEEVPKELDSVKYNIPWLDSFSINNTIINRVDVPSGYFRKKEKEGSFVHWLRRLPLKVGNPAVQLYNGKLKGYQNGHAYVINMDVGSRDLQQCADATMRLRAEYLYGNNKHDSIHFNYTNGANVQFSKWKTGLYPVPKSGKVNWVNSTKNNKSYASFKKYMIQIFNYAGTLSLSRELEPVVIESIQPGDIFCYGGSPGHAVMVMDVAVNELGNKLFLLAQSYMPAQEMHILKNPNDEIFSPWYNLSEIGEEIITPEWNFNRSELMRWN
jgi:hypothetical protein